MNGDVFLRKFYEKPSSFREIVVGSHHNYGNKVFMRSINKDDSLKEITFSQFYEDNINFGTGLFSLGLKEKRFAVISETRYEWVEAYLVAIMGGGIIVPLDKELNIEQIKSFIEFAESLETLNQMGIDYIISYDGECGGKEYGESLPKSLECKIAIISYI